ncbi:mitochondrial required protein 1 [Scheffersomyces xylosifermentans]|uniref:mitochondrial required protein 1 n=1 Tax=Scheffersomyces xylosifermentans TaxID=1304137 RepID=UPI00315CBEAF
MGVYIPPPNDKDDKGSKDKTSDKTGNGHGNNTSKNDSNNNNNNNNNNTNNNNNIVKPTSSPPVPPNSTTIVIPNPASWIPHNPSAGLFWGPLTPASDNRPALYGMTGLQFAVGLVCFRYARILFRPRTVIAPGGALITPKGSFWKALLPATAGAAATYGCGLELSRLMLPYDPWYEEARHYRKLATKNNDKPNAWFGAYDYYTPMTTKAWIEKVGNWIKATEKEIEHENEFIEIGIVRDNKDGHSDDKNIEHLLVPVKSNILSKLNKKGKYSEIYQKLQESNAERYKALLSTDLKDVTELNKAERIDLILEGKSPFYNPDYTKQDIQLGNNSIETDDEFDMVWLNFDPWDELKLETDYDIRLIPHWQWEESATHAESVAASNENNTPKSEATEKLETS